MTTYLSVTMHLTLAVTTSPSMWKSLRTNSTFIKGEVERLAKTEDSQFCDVCKTKDGSWTAETRHTQLLGMKSLSN
jgi:hypothetical protein